MILNIDPSQKKKKGAAWFELDDDLDEAWIEEHQEFLVEEQRTKITKKFEKDNEKLKAEKSKPLPEKELKERLQAVKELQTKLKKENKSGKVEAEGKGASVEKFIASIKKLDERVRTLETQAEDRDGNKEVALGTSKIVSRVVPDDDDVRLTLLTELHRSALDCCVFEKVRRPDREVLLQDASRQVPMGNQVCRGRRRLAILTADIFIPPHTQI